ncbi:hypothetical protein T492DRAFT_1121678 [Pavlovales sp. CCMP2436]|nr:hypothetical protein T492DRAFT_1121678 [Pavlovales sp. CCMP2436]
MCVLLAYGEPSLVGDAQTAGALFGHILLYGAAVFPQTYAISLAFDSPSSAQISLSHRAWSWTGLCSGSYPGWMMVHIAQRVVEDDGPRAEARSSAGAHARAGAHTRLSGRLIVQAVSR